MKRKPNITTPDNTGSRAASTAHISYHSAAVEGFGTAEFGDQLEPTVGFQYPDEGDEPAPVVRDAWRHAPLLDKCQRRLATIRSSDQFARPLLDKRLEVLQFALREAVEEMDLGIISRLCAKAIATAERIATEQLAAATPSTREMFEDIVLTDDADRGKVVIYFPKRPTERTRRWLKICGFMGGGDGATYWRRRTFRRGDNIALERARDCLATIVEDRARLTAASRAEAARVATQPLCA
ncbi:MAG: hypothetical protein ABMA13_22875 [Chthoniobacteraceae bacterium]